MLFIATDVMKPLQRKIISEKNFDTLVDFLKEYYPNGFDKPTDIHTMFKKIELSDYDMKLNSDDIIILIERPAVTAALVGGSALIAWFANTAIMMAVNFAISKIFMPDQTEVQDRGAISSVYSLNNQQNRAKLGGIIPVGYGTFRMFPSYIEQQYYKYENNEEYLYLLLCIGQGRYSIDKLLIDTLDMTKSIDVQYKIVNKENFHNIKDYIGNSKYYMRTNLLSTPYGYEMKNHVWSDFYSIHSGVDKVEFDYIYPNGYYNINKNDGRWHNARVGFKIVFYRSDHSILSESEHISTGQTREAQRNTIQFNINSSYKYFRIVKHLTEWDGSSQGNLVMSRVKEIYKNTDCTNYGDISLLWVRMKATNAISSAGQQQVNGFFRRLDKTNDLKSVVSDIYTNKEYGAGLNSYDLHFENTKDKVNGVLESSMTVWDSMKKVTKSQKYTIYPVGQDLILKHDAPNKITMALYNETNILKDSFAIQYNFKDDQKSYDCYEVSYRTGADWNPGVERYPSNGILPQTIELWGVTDSTKAKEMAKYFWKQDSFRSKIITFDTGIQGFSLEFLDKIKISHSSLMWGEAGEVVSVNGDIIETSDKVTANSNITFRNIDGSVSDMLAFNKIEDYKINVPNIPSWVNDGIFYTIGVANEFLVSSVKPKDNNSVTVECIEYNEDIYV